MPNTSQRETDTRIILPRNVKTRRLVLAGTAALFVGMLLGASSQPASADCEPALGQPTGHGICPGDRTARIRMFGFHYEDLKNNDGKYRTGERPVSTVKGGRFLEIQFWGAEQYIYSPDSRNMTPTRRRLIAHEQGDGTAIDIETDMPFVTVGVNGPVEDWEEGRDKLDNNKIKPLPLIRFQFRWYEDNFRRIIFDDQAKKPATWEGCAWLCPVGIDPTEAHYYVATAKTREELARLGLVYRPEEMAVPQGAPRSAVWTADLR